MHGCVRVVARSAAAVGFFGERGRALEVEALLVKRSWCLRLCDVCVRAQSCLVYGRVCLLVHAPVGVCE